MRINFPGMYNKISGPWPCEKCKQQTQFAEISTNINKIFCKNPHCGFTRIIDKAARTIVESDGSVWVYDPNTSAKKRINMR